MNPLSSSLRQVAESFVPHGLQAQAGGGRHVRSSHRGPVGEPGAGPAEVEKLQILNLVATQ